jgi:hypothetical protein
MAHLRDRPLPVDQPENLELIGYNLNVPLRDPETFQNNKFDFIHSRFVFPGIRRRRWATYLRDMKLLLRRGAWVQIMEYHPMVQSNNGRLNGQSAVIRWWQSYNSAMERMDRDPRIGPRLGQVLNDSSYRDVAVDIEQLHIGGWSEGMLLSPSSLLFLGLLGRCPAPPKRSSPKAMPCLLGWQLISHRC